MATDGNSLMDRPMLYVKYRGEEAPPMYAFGPEWVAMALYMDDIEFDTEDKAVLYWYHDIYKKEMQENADKGKETETAKDHS